MHVQEILADTMGVGVGLGHSDVGSLGDHARNSWYLLFFPLYTAYCRRMFDASFRALCEHAQF